LVMCCVSFFFFSSRRRHTRFSRDWSSDVCSSDLPTDILNFPDESINQYIGMEQTYTDNTFYTQNALSMSWKIKKWTLTEEYSVRSEERRVGKECRFGLSADA